MIAAATGKFYSRDLSPRTGSVCTTVGLKLLLAPLLLHSLACLYTDAALNFLQFRCAIRGSKYPPPARSSNSNSDTKVNRINRINRITRD